MRVPGRVYAHTGLFSQSGHEEALQQVANVATLPGILKASMAMPDIHWGYGFPIGGVAAMDAEDGVVSPGGVGFDINCGVRLVRTGLSLEDVRPRLEPLMTELMRRVPQGSGPHGALGLKEGELERLAEEGAAFLAGRGLATPDDLAHTEEGGVMPGADAAAVSRKAFDRGRTQVGSLGSGNHFIEVQVVDDVLDARAASAFGVAAGQVVVMIHSGSQGLRPPGLHRLPRPDGRSRCARRHRAAGQAARLRPSRLIRRPASTSPPWLAPATSPSPTAR